MSETPEPYRTDGPQTLGDFMEATADDLLAMDIDKLQLGLTILARRMFEISQERMAVQDAVARDSALAGELRALEAVKSSWQSVLRTLRDISRS